MVEEELFGKVVEVNDGVMTVVIFEEDVLGLICGSLPINVKCWR